MGANMARRLADMDYVVAATFDHFHQVAESIAEELGAKAMTSLADVTAAADVIFTVVTDDAAMEEIFSGEESVLKGAEGKTFIHCATVSPEAHRKAADAAAAVGAKTLAASMASSITQARQGTLYLMIGGEEETFKAHEQLLKDMSVSLR